MMATPHRMPGFFEKKACAMITAVFFVRGYREAE